MPPVAVDEFQQALTELAARSGEAASGLVSRLGRLSAPEARAFITDAYPALLAPFLAASGQLATQWYAEQPTPERPAGSSLYVPEPARPAQPDQLAISGRWAVGQSDAATVLKRNASRNVMNASRDTVIVNSVREGTRWVRKAQLNACGFCKMLATRASKEFGAGQRTRRGNQRVYSYRSEGVFLDEETGQYYLGVIGKRGRLRGSRPMGSKYHDNCKCIAVPVRDNVYDPPDYVEAWTQEYDNIVESVGTDNLALISKIMDEGRLRPDRLTKIVPALPAAAAAAAPQPIALDRPTDDPLPSLPMKENVGTIDDDIAVTNPNFNGDNPRYKDNCTHCVTAYELRRRGYDVEATAAPRAGGRFYDKEILNGWVDADGNQRPRSVVKTQKQLEEIVRGWGDGARGFVTMTIRSGGGHIISVENVGGKIRFFDPQDAAADASELLKTRKRRQGSALTYIRTDDLTPTSRIVDPDDPLVISRVEGESQRQAARAAEEERKAYRAQIEAQRPKPPTKEMMSAAEAEGFGPTSGVFGDFLIGIQEGRLMSLEEQFDLLKDYPDARREAFNAGLDWYNRWLLRQL